MKTALTLLMLSTVFSLNAFAQDTAHTVLERYSGSNAYSVAFSPDSSILASVNRSRSVVLWDVETGNYLRTLEKHTGGVYSVTFSPDGQTLFSRSRNPSTYYLWDVVTGEKKLSFTYSRAAFSTDMRTIASTSDDNTIRLWDVETGTLKHTLTADNVSSVFFSPDGQTLASWSRDSNTIHLWDVETGTLKHTLNKHTDDVWGAVFSPDGQTLASWSRDSNTIHLWNVDAGTLKHTLPMNNVWIVKFSPDGQTLVSVGGGENTIHLWDMETGTLRHTLAEHTGNVTNVKFSPDGQTLVSAGGRDKTIRLWDVDTGTLKRTLPTHGGWTIEFSPDGQTLVSAGGRENTIRLSDVETGTPKFSITTGLRVFSPDGQTLASTDDANTVRLWDVKTGTLNATLVGHTKRINSVVFSPDGRTLASGSNANTVRLWKIIDTRIGITVLPVDTPAIGDQLTLKVDITNGENVTGFQAKVIFDATALRYVNGYNGNYLPNDSFFVDPVIEGNEVILGATSLANSSSGDGTLATLMFEFIAIKESTLSLPEAAIVDSEGKRLPFFFKDISVIVGVPRLREDVNLDGVVDILDLTLVAASFGKPAKMLDPSYIPGDINKDGIVDSADLAEITILNEYLGYSSSDIRAILRAGEENYVYNPADVNGDGIIDIVDLVLVAGALGNKAAAPAAWARYGLVFTKSDVQQWLSQAQQQNLTDPASHRGILFLQQLLAALTPKKTSLLPNYPNPFNPETWIPYQLAAPADVSISIYAVDGKLVRLLDLGHQTVGIYQGKSRAAHWDGKNFFGESVASGVYFYTLKAGDFKATRKMLIRK